MGVRSSLFLDPDPTFVDQVAAVGADRIELYTESYATAFGTCAQEPVWQAYAATASRAQVLGLGVNAGHDLDLNNLRRFLQIPGIAEVSIGHALIVESLDLGMESVIRQYLAITGG
jgi:pyridoxine 5-phosphate synthase